MYSEVKRVNGKVYVLPYFLTDSATKFYRIRKVERDFCFNNVYSWVHVIRIGGIS